MRIVHFRSTYTKPYPLKAVGTEHYHQEIKEESDLSGEIKACLVHIRGDIVAVEIRGKYIGHLSRVDARRFYTKLIELELSDAVVECSTDISNCVLQSEPSYDIYLDLDIDKMSVNTRR